MAGTKLPRFKGDISAQDDLRTNIKGGSFSAILKKRLAEAFGLAKAENARPQTLSAATVQFDDRHKLMLMTVQGEFDKDIEVRRTGANSFELLVDGDESEEIDEVAAAFVEFKKKLFAQGRLNLSDPMDADAFEALSDRALADAQALHKGR